MRPTLADARDALHAHFGYESFRPGQEEAVAHVLAGRDTLVILPTGGGKSLCYQVPALLLDGLTVVVSPLISLMKDQVDALTARGLPAAFINSSLSGAAVADRFARAARREIKLLYVAPERFDGGFSAERLRAIGVALLAVDEAHCVSEWGHDFRPSYLRISDVREQLGAPPTLALTATATPEVRVDIARQLHLRTPATVITGFDRRNLRYHVVATPSANDKDDTLVDLLREREGLAVVYASTRKSVERIAGVLERARIPAAGYHAGLDDDRRREVQDAFMREDIRAIVATNAFGMGIDKPNVRLVVHHAMPGTLEAYYQEAGRAGRDGMPSDCVLLHAFPDRFTHEFFIRNAYPERGLVEQVYDAVRRRADEHGILSLASDALAGSLPGKITGREVDACVRILARANALQVEPESASRIFVRLLATPERIRTEVADPVERELLRALWRAVRGRISSGAVIDLSGLPPGFGQPAEIAVHLATLERRQILLWERLGGGLRLLNRDRALSAFDIDWQTLDRRRRGELAKLDAMQKYAYTPGCRRGFVLRYFGDPAARQRCDGCDNCLGVKRAPSPSAGRAPRDRKVRGARVRGDSRGTRVAPAAALPDAAPLEGRDAALFASLRALRGTIARADRLPAYVVFTDRTLVGIARSRPRTLAALAAVHGVGPARLEKYGERVLRAVADGNDTEAA